MLFWTNESQESGLSGLQTLFDDNTHALANTHTHTHKHTHTQTHTHTHTHTYIYIYIYNFVVRDDFLNNYYFQLSDYNDSFQLLFFGVHLFVFLYFFVCFFVDFSLWIGVFFSVLTDRLGNRDMGDKEGIVYIRSVSYDMSGKILYNISILIRELNSFFIDRFIDQINWFFSHELIVNPLTCVPRIFLDNGTMSYRLILVGFKGRWTMLSVLVSLKNTSAKIKQINRERNKKTHQNRLTNLLYKSLKA